MLLAVLATAVIAASWAWSIWSIVTQAPKWRANWKAGTDAKLAARAAEARCAKLDRQTAVLRAHNEAYDHSGVLGDRLIPDIVESTGEDIGFVYEVLDRAYKRAREEMQQ